MTAATGKRCLQIVVAALALVPVSAGLAGVILGPSAFADASEWPVDLDSHLRYLSGIFLAVGIAFWSTVPAIERKTALFRLAATAVIIGGIARLLSLLLHGAPSAPHLGGLAWSWLSYRFW